MDVSRRFKNVFCPLEKITFYETTLKYTNNNTKDTLGIYSKQQTL